MFEATFLNTSFSCLPNLLDSSLSFPFYDRLLPNIPAAAAAESLQLCPTLCDPVDGSPPGTSVPGILQARTLEWVAISCSNACMYAKSLQLFPTLCDPIDGSPPGTSVPGIHN